MQVQVEDRLPGIWTGIDDQSVSRLGEIKLFGQVVGNCEHMAYQGFIGFRQIVHG